MAKDSKKYKRKKMLGSYQYVSVVFSAALALFVIGLFGTLILQANKLTSVIKQNIELQVYLNKDISSSQRTRIESELAASDYVLTTEGKAEITFISKEEAAKQFIQDTGEDFTEFLGDNPLRDALTIKVNEAFQSNDQLKSVQSQIENISGVFEVTYVDNLAN